jgi:hypothetical protein
MQNQVEAGPATTPVFIEVGYNNQVFRIPSTSATRDWVEQLFHLPPHSLCGLNHGNDVFPLSERSGFTADLVALIAQRRLTCLLRTPPVAWGTARPLDLRNGVGGKTGEFVYSVPGITITSSAKVFANGNYYYMYYMFQGDAASSEHTEYWLGDGQANNSLEFKFKRPRNVAEIPVCATAARGFTDRRSDYQITALTDTERKDVTNGFINTLGDEFGSWHAHPVLKERVSLIRFDLTKASTHGPCLKKIEILTVE